MTRTDVKARRPGPDAEPLDLTGVDNLGFRLRLAQNLVFRDFNERFAELAITQSLWTILVLIEANPGLRQSDIGSALNIHPANLVDLVESLIKRGLILKSPVPNDRRAFGLYMTVEGANFAAKAGKVHEKHLLHLKQRLGDDYELVHRALKKLID